MDVNRHAERNSSPLVLTIAAADAARRAGGMLTRSGPGQAVGNPFGVRRHIPRQADTASVIDAIHPASPSMKRLQVLILTNPKNPAHHPCAVSDYNTGATLSRASLCVHVISIVFAK